MSQNENYDFDSPDSLRRLHARVRNNSDSISQLRERQSEHKVEIQRSREDIAELRSSSVNRFQFDGTIELLQNTLDALTKNVEEIRAGVWWGVKLVLGAIGLALLALLFNLKNVKDLAP